MTKVTVCHSGHCGARGGADGIQDTVASILVTGLPSPPLLWYPSLLLSPPPPPPCLSSSSSVSLFLWSFFLRTTCCHVMSGPAWWETTTLRASSSQASDDRGLPDTFKAPSCEPPTSTTHLSHSQNSWLTESTRPCMCTGLKATKIWVFCFASW